MLALITAAGDGAEWEFSLPAAELLCQAVRACPEFCV
jgi:hypothetical protein